MEPRVIDEAMCAYADATSRLNRERHSMHDAVRKDLKKTEQGLRDIVDSMQRGGFSRSLNERLQQLEATRDQLEKRLASVPPVEVSIPPSSAFRTKVKHLRESLNRPEERTQAVDLIRRLVRRIIIRPGALPRSPIGLTVYGDVSVLVSPAINDENNAPIEASVVFQA